MSGASGRVLVVDDNKVIRQLIRVNLELEGLEVVTAADGAECLDVVHQVRPDVVTLDVVMPRLDGLRAAARLRSDPRTRELPLVIVSACTQHEVASGLSVGVDAFLAKPFDPAELVQVVRELMGTHRRGDVERPQQHPQHSEHLTHVKRPGLPGLPGHPGCAGHAGHAGHVGG
ncbi:response regulator [Streptomyces sp. NPDC052051]|uniref:response regulator n=1 Tax=Streptomyces sp. NPDC052051 TaxID=3154649 RepID=UPI0034273935